VEIQIGVSNGCFSGEFITAVDIGQYVSMFPVHPDHGSYVQTKSGTNREQEIPELQAQQKLKRNNREHVQEKFGVSLQDVLYRKRSGWEKNIPVKKGRQTYHAEHRQVKQEESQQ
jgi:hypothetical protein